MGQSLSTSLLASVRAGDLPTTQKLLQSGADVNATHEDDQTLMHAAASEGHVSIMEELMKSGGNIQAVDKLGYTPLHNAAYMGRVHSCKLLVEKGAPVSAIDKDGMTPLHWAVLQKHPECVALLVQYGANLEIKNHRDYKPMDLALKVRPRVVREAIVAAFTQSGPARRVSVSAHAATDAESVRVGRLAGLCKAWGTAKFIHPALLHSGICWEDALLDVLPLFTGAPAGLSPEAYRSALDHMLGWLGDGNTRTLPSTHNTTPHHADESEQDERQQPYIHWLPGNVALIIVTLHDTLRSYSMMADFMQVFADANLKAKAIIFDVRGLSSPPATTSVLGETRVTGEQDTHAELRYMFYEAFKILLRTDLMMPTYRQRFYKGSVESWATGTDAFISGVLTSAPETLRPSTPHTTRPVPMAFVMNARTPQPLVDLVCAAQTAGLAKVLYETEDETKPGAIVKESGISGVLVDANGVMVSIRKHERIRPDGVIGFTPDIVVAKNAPTSHEDAPPSSTPQNGSAPTTPALPSPSAGAESTTEPAEGVVNATSESGESSTTDQDTNASATPATPAAPVSSSPAIVRAFSEVSAVLSSGSSALPTPRASSAVSSSAYPGRIVTREYPAPLPSLEQRLLSLFTLWNTVQFFYPYRDLIDCNWEDILLEYIPKFEKANSSLSYALCVAELVTHLRDTHAYAANPDLNNYIGTHGPGVDVRLVDNKTIITHFQDPTMPQATGLKVGDAVVSIDSEPILARRARLAQILPASTTQALNWRVHQRLLAGPANSYLTLTVASGVTVKLPRTHRITGSERLGAYTAAASGASGDAGVAGLVEGGVAYIDTVLLSSEQVDKALAAVQPAQCLILDVRGFPRGTLQEIVSRVASRHVNVASSFTQMLLPSSLTHFNQRAPEIVEMQTISPSLQVPLSYYQIPKLVVALVNEQTASKAEYQCLMLEAALGSVSVTPSPTPASGSILSPVLTSVTSHITKKADETADPQDSGVVFIGTPTNGVVGELTNLHLPGEVFVGFTCAGIRRATGEQFQRIGIAPQIVVEPTLDGIVNGQDEAFDRALDYCREYLRSHGIEPAGGQSSSQGEPEGDMVALTPRSANLDTLLDENDDDDDIDEEEQADEQHVDASTTSHSPHQTHAAPGTPSTTRGESS
eukprot:TRINITY_DN5368_c0_g1_i3.p1 TRINITY_DN5368_c0_g1~~TRINITY_DN5368_c0_g1_i3.p1  ORF type:complete len:1154 (+),score=302.24 TRINITY_DN5368_c0_g1_i3:74-3535(+)